VTFLLAAAVHGRPWAHAIFGACCGILIFYRGFRMLQRKRLIENTPASKIRSASMGLVEVSGLAVGPYTITAPVTGLSCYMHRTVAWEYRQAGKNTQWVKTADETQHVAFYLDDNTGCVLVDPQGAEMEIHRDYSEVFSQSMFSSTLGFPTNVSGFLSRHGVNCSNKIKVEEYCIKPKNALFVLGTLAENHDTAASPVPIRTVAEQARRSLFQISASPSGTKFSLGMSAEIHSPISKPVPALDPAQRVKVSAALMKAGITSPAAWATAGIVMDGSAAGAAPALENAPETQFDLQPPVVLKKGEHNPAFYVSWQSQREVVKSLGWKSALMIWGGPALTLLSIWLLFHVFTG
jgi:hypothetical protein